MKLINKIPQANQQSIKHGLVRQSFILPLLIVFIAFNLYPLANSFYASFMVDFYKDPEFVGFENYILLGGKDSPMIQSLINIFLFLPIAVLVIQLVSLYVAKMVTRTPHLIQYIAIIVFFLPYMIPITTISSVFAGFFFSETSFLSKFVLFLNSYEITQPIMQFLGDEENLKETFLHRRSESPVLFIYTYILFCWVIKYFGFFCLIYYISLKSISNDILEAAKIEGADVKAIFYKIEIPLIKSMIFMMSILCLLFLLSDSSLQSSMWNTAFRGQEKYLYVVNGVLYGFWANPSLLGAATWVYVGFVSTLFLIGYFCLKLFKRVYK